MNCKPNFFLVGAPKCGTTALYSYLKTHPNIFMPEAKEPHYFAKDFTDYPSFKTLDSYLSLFKNSDKQHTAIGEASVWYLYSDVALELIKQFNPDAKIIALIRNPVDLAHSMHHQALYNFNEDQQDFEKAWRLQDTRATGKEIPRGCRASQILQYRRVARLGDQIERLLTIFPSRQVKIILFEDMITNPQQTYEETLEFLGLSSDGRSHFPNVNESKTHKSTLLGWLTQTPPRPILLFVRFMRERLGINIAKPLAWIRKINDKPRKRTHLDKRFRDELIEEFKPDIEKLEKILNKDLENWKKRTQTRKP